MLLGSVKWLNVSQVVIRRNQTRVICNIFMNNIETFNDKWQMSIDDDKMVVRRNILNIHARMHACMHARTHARTHTHTHTHTNKQSAIAHTQCQKHSDTHACTHACTHTRMHTCMHTHTHAHMHAHTHACTLLMGDPFNHWYKCKMHILNTTQWTLGTWRKLQIERNTVKQWLYWAVMCSYC